MLCFQWLVTSLSQETLLDKEMVVLNPTSRIPEQCKTCPSKRQVPKHWKTKFFSQNPKNAFSKGLMVFQQHNFESRHDMRKIEGTSPNILWFELRSSVFSQKARRFHLMWSWKPQAPRIPSCRNPPTLSQFQDHRQVKNKALLQDP